MDITYGLKVKLLGLLLLVGSISVIYLSFLIIFFNFKINIGAINLSPIFIKVINFGIILIIFGYLAYVGIIMILSRK
ncbi:hypothetical protein KN1_18060 [Stygiolobus caldivivus]|uniref:Uncharacterized protein n=1 Tax=Stygiolobus caldivivus TaxID=2824673 RepID=A0A8D5U851_9CREN|nr:hypothetical protein KN1_18060 [Stygiolobus caldivivus]